METKFTKLLKALRGAIFVLRQEGHSEDAKFYEEIMEASKEIKGRSGKTFILIQELTLQRIELETELKKELPCYFFSDEEKIKAYNEKEAKVVEIQKQIDNLILNQQ
jgi:hypothetical protein